MGNKQSIFTDDQLEAYQDCTFFTKQDVLRIFERYKSIDFEKRLPNSMLDKRWCQEFTLPLENIENMPELKENPFRRRICEVFSRDNKGNLSFDDFLNLFSVFSESAPKEVKAVYAFKIYDFDRDNCLKRSDLQRTLKALTQKSTAPIESSDFVDGEDETETQTALNEEEEKHILDQVLKEADLDDNNELSYIEFEHVVSRAPDFLTTFHIRI